MKRILLICLFIFAFPATGLAFNDIKDSLFKDDILLLKEQDIKFLTDDGMSFRPNDPITRKEAALILYWAVSSHFSEGYNDWLATHYEPQKRLPKKEPVEFIDLKKYDNKDRDVLVDVLRQYSSYDVFNGYINGTFGPDDLLTRGQAVTIINAAYYLPNVVDKNTPFIDLHANYYQQAVRNLFAYGITNGTSNNTFSPERIVTRGEFASLLARLSKFTDSKTTRYVTLLEAPLLNRINVDKKSKLPLKENYAPHVEKVTQETAPLFKLSSTDLEKNDYYYVEFLSNVLAKEKISHMNYNEGTLFIQFDYTYLYEIKNLYIMYAEALSYNRYLLKIEEGLDVVNLQISTNAFLK